MLESQCVEIQVGRPPRCDVLMSSLTQDHSGLELKLFAREIGHHNPAVFVCDAPEDLCVDAFTGPLVEGGWALVDEVVLTTQFGDAQARTR